MTWTTRCRTTLLRGLAGLAMTIGAAAGAGAQTVEIEPNHPCSSAQVVATAEGAFGLTGRRDAGDVDFFRVSGPPGHLLAIELQGQGAGAGTLGDSVLGAFTSSCLSVLGTDDDSGSGLDSRLEVIMPADGTLVIAASGFPDFAFSGSGDSTGTYRLSATTEPVTGELTGRLLDAETGEPVRSADLILSRCSGGSCGGSGTSTFSDVNGRFRFQSEPGFLMTGGEYELLAFHPRFVTLEPGPFEIHGKTDIDLGDLAMVAIPTAGSIRGRLVDEATGDPLPGSAAPFARAHLEFCPGGASSCFFVDSQNTDLGGAFHFVGTEFDPLEAGSYRVTAEAAQYVTTRGDLFPVAEDEDKVVGDVRVKSLPVRLALVQDCGDIPSQGGRCRFTVRVTSGLLGALRARGWSVVNASLFGSFVDHSAFQLTPRAITLLPGGSTVLPFAFDVPGTVQNGAFICTMFYAAPEDRPLEPYAAQHLFCLQKTSAGLQRVPDAELRRLGSAGVAGVAAGVRQPVAPHRHPFALRP